jgi:hypothetical protein
MGAHHHPLAQAFHAHYAHYPSFHYEEDAFPVVQHVRATPTPSSALAPAPASAPAPALAPAPSTKKRKASSTSFVSWLLRLVSLSITAIVVLFIGALQLLEESDRHQNLLVFDVVKPTETNEDLRAIVDGHDEGPLFETKRKKRLVVALTKGAHKIEVVEGRSGKLVERATLTNLPATDWRGVYAVGNSPTAPRRYALVKVPYGNGQRPMTAAPITLLSTQSAPNIFVVSPSSPSPSSSSSGTTLLTRSDLAVLNHQFPKSISSQQPSAILQRVCALDAMNRPTCVNELR